MRSLEIEDYEAFLRLSVEEPAAFWQATCAELGYEWMTPWTAISDGNSDPVLTQWFIGGETNAAYNAVHRWSRDPQQADEVAVVDVPEIGIPRSFTFAELAARVRREAAALHTVGVGRGDRAGLFVTFGIDSAVLLLAVASVGAVAVPIFTGYGSSATRDRMKNAAIETVFVSLASTRRGRKVDLGAVVAEALPECPAVKQVVIVGEGGKVGCPGVAELCWSDVVARTDDNVDPIPLPAMHPWLVAYTSGTTGAPKGVVHTHAGLPLKVAQEMSQVMEIGPGSVVLRITDLGWVGGPYTIMSGLTAGATVVLFRGTPTWPKPSRIWELVAAHGVTHLGLSPTLARQLKLADAKPALGTIATLRMTTTTGEAWDEATYRWFSRVVDGRPIINHSGGTEVGNLLCTIPVRPIEFGVFNSVVPGVSLAVVASDGSDLVGEPGELAVTRPFVGCAVGFADGDMARFRRAYWNRYPGCWIQVDIAVHHRDGSWRLLGRSDDRIKVSGRSISPDDVESMARELPGVNEAALIGVPDSTTGSRLILFLTPDSSGVLASVSTEHIRNEIAHRLGKSFTPKSVIVVDRLPHTASGKLSRTLIRAAYLRLDSAPANLDPDSAQAVAQIAGLTPCAADGD